MFVRNCNDCENTSTWRIGNEFNLILDGDVVVYSNQSSRWCEVFWRNFVKVVLDEFH